MQLEAMIATHPDVDGSTNAALIRAIEQMFDCAAHCTSCADACIAEEMPDLTQCICRSCAEDCRAAADSINA